MKALARNCSVMTATALLVACAAQRDNPEEREADAAPPPPPPVRAEEFVLPAMPEVAHSEVAAPADAAATRAISSVSPSFSMATEKQALYRVAPIHQPPYNTEKYQHQNDNPVHRVAEEPVSTFSIDVDTGAYANVRRFLNDGQLPPQDAVRVEEMINYFDYQYAPPSTRATPFKVATELAPAPWNKEAWLLRIGIKGFEVSNAERPPANLVFLIDVSGSMQSPDKLPLLKNAFRLLTDQLSARDRVSMVVYAGSSGVVLEPTPGDQKHRILEALNRLEAGGSTNGAEGIERAYQLAKQAHIAKGINRVVLATDGDFNVGTVDFESLVDMAERQRSSGTALTTLGFGTGNYNDQLLERLADAGNGNYSYVDSLSEARKVLVSELSSTLFTIAKDVKIQVEFNPAEVVEYRLIGYENRMLAREDFNNDKVDAGEIGAGHRITALYEVVPAGAKGRVDPLRYGAADAAAKAGGGEIANVRLRYKLPDSDTSQLLEYPIARASLVSADKVSTDLRFAASVAAFGQLLRGGRYTERFDYRDVAALAKSSLGEDREGYRREFVSLVTLAQSLTQESGGEKVGQIGR
ncbi:MAG TPA: VWA domain-containing protein [Povalibacter sp.]|uniref:vWA domain-containing protein n=1 Tax=Povalibacter sp. TaxID=1962978 RepID=UPI002BB2C53C|nr:VWA domain-containing protein [Povalibacter sp.]HMN46046.1 VWA domain-containing protein [Povalibacter sp.]